MGKMMTTLPHAYKNKVDLLTKANYYEKINLFNLYRNGNFM